MRYDTAVADLVTEELRLIRQNVPGVRGSITATKDGLLLAHDMHGLEPTQIAALVAATHAVAVRASLSTECGQLKEVITRGTDGYLAVYGAERSGAPIEMAAEELARMLDELAVRSSPNAGAKAVPKALIQSPPPPR